MGRATVGLAAIGLAAVLIARAAAQSPSPTANSSTSEPRRPYDVRSFGMYRAVILQGDFTAKVGLSVALATSPSTGVGAVSDARGEITIHDGKLIVSYGRPGTHPAPEAETAALLAIASAGEWQTITIDRDVLPNEIDDFLSRTAGAHGLDPQGPFPFQIRGTLASYTMHVNAAPTEGPHGMGHPAAVTVERKGDAIEGAVAGIYVSRDLVGVISHGGTRTHSHWVALDARATAHLDLWGLKAGAVLSIPAR